MRAATGIGAHECAYDLVLETLRALPLDFGSETAWAEVRVPLEERGLRTFVDTRPRVGVAFLSIAQRGRAPECTVAFIFGAGARVVELFGASRTDIIPSRELTQLERDERTLRARGTEAAIAAANAARDRVDELRRRLGAAS